MKNLFLIIIVNTLVFSSDSIEERLIKLEKVVAELQKQNGNVNTDPLSSILNEIKNNKENDSKNEIKIDNEYVKKIKIYDIEATKINTYSKKNVPAVKFKIQNNGNKTITKLVVTVYYKNNENQNIYENNYAIVTDNPYSLNNKSPLKPNYIWQLKQGQYYTDEKVPNEWKKGNVEIKIIQLELY